MTCHNCRIDAPKHGKHRNGLQRYRCSQCTKTFTETHAEAFHIEDHLKTERGQLVIQLLCEGNSIRTVERVTKFHRNIIIKLLLIAGQRCGNLLATKVKGVPSTDVQCDEIWGFVGKKKYHVHGGETKFSEVVEAWCFVRM